MTVLLEQIAGSAGCLCPQMGQTGQNWSGGTPDALIDHIIERYHTRHRQQFPECIRLATLVEDAHRDKPGCPRGLADHLSTLAQELECHMMKEERVLFPMLRRASVGQLLAPVSMMRIEHEQHREALDHLEYMTGDLVPPQDACRQWQALYVGLRQLREDLMEHIALENNILFLDRSQLT